MRLLLHAALVLVVMSGCGVSMRRIPRSAWSVAAGEASVFETMQTVVRTHGYAIGESDPATGRFSFPASRRVRPNEVITFTVQCYSDGYVTLVPSGPRVSPTSDGFQFPSDLWEEYRTLATDITAELRRR